MFHCQECVSSSSLVHGDTLETCKGLPVAKASSCPRICPHTFQDDFKLPPGGCPECLNGSMVYSRPFTPEHVQNCLDCRHGNVTVDCSALVPCYCHDDGGCHRLDGYNLITGLHHKMSSHCTCQNYILPLPHQKFYRETITPTKYRLPTLLQHCNTLPVHEYAVDALPSYGSKIPVKGSSDNVNFDGKEKRDGQCKVREDDFSLPEDILDWKRKHIEQLQVQQTEVSENNITDELKDIKTSSSVVSLLLAPVTSDPEDQDGCQMEQKPKESPASENSPERLDVDRLKVELRRQELKVKLYESMLRKHRLNLKTLQLSMTDQKVSYEEQINALQKELFHLRQLPKVRLNPWDGPEPDFANAETQTEFESLSSEESFNWSLRVTSCDTMNYATRDERTEAKSEDMSRKDQLVRLQEQISEEEEALSSMREDLASKDQHLKTLRKTLRELSSCNCELLEKNLELEGMLHRKRGRSAGTKVEALEYRLLREIDGCISELDSIANALVALSSGRDPLPSFLLHRHDNAVANDFVSGNSTEAAESRLKRVSEMQSRIEGLRELIMQRILMSHYRQS